MRRKKLERTRKTSFIRVAALAAAVATLLNCNVSRSIGDVPLDGGDHGPVAASSTTARTLEFLQAQIDQGLPQGALRVATLPEAAITISVEPGPGLERSCLAIMATGILLKAGYSAVPSWNHDMTGPIVHLFASANFSDGMTTLVLQGSIGHHLGVAPDLYEAALISGNRNPTTGEVEAILARVVQSELFQKYVAAIQPSHGARVGLLQVTSDQIKAACDANSVADKPRILKRRGKSDH